MNSNDWLPSVGLSVPVFETLPGDFETTPIIIEYNMMDTVSVVTANSNY